jgi:hypothetical protein
MSWYHHNAYSFWGFKVWTKFGNIIDYFLDLHPLTFSNLEKMTRKINDFRKNDLTLNDFRHNHVRLNYLIANAFRRSDLRQNAHMK